MYVIMGTYHKLLLTEKGGNLLTTSTGLFSEDTVVGQFSAEQS